jgi:hypothetical protein
MRSDPSYVMYPWWPVDGDAWIHPVDVAAGRALIPGLRVFAHAGRQGDYHVLRYGDRVVRVLPALWMPLRGDGLLVGDLVEVRSRGGRNRPRIGRIREMVWNPHAGCIEYQLQRRGLRSSRRYTADDLQSANPIQPREQVVVAESEEE